MILGRKRKKNSHDFCAYRLIEVKYCVKKSFAYSETTSGFLRSVVISGKFPPCTMLPMHIERVQDRGELDGCCCARKMIRYNKTQPFMHTNCKPRLNLVVVASPFNALFTFASKLSADCNFQADNQGDLLIVL